DKIIVYKTEKDLVKLLKKIKPDIRFIGKDWKGKHFTGDDLPIKVIYNSRNHTYSSSSLRARVYESEKKIIGK
ncbi:MAG: glycerol-3-phosphate cytidylyltransferase, partial [Candidatus Pacebacteria bacterium]|nr:glycerol-3-phosphate cytidylyltransferase [Candidatus Paceibacterota bacterium]